MRTLQPVRYALRGILARWFEEPVSSFLVRLGVTPVALTTAGLLAAAGAAYLAATGQFWQAGIVVAFGAILDLLDGSVARRSNKTSRRGALMDSVFDRLQEGAVLLGLLIYYTAGENQNQTAAVLTFVAFMGSVMVSYTRARAEALGLAGSAGFFTRPERVIITVAFLLAQTPVWALWILAIGTSISALWRFTEAWLADKKKDKTHYESNPKSSQ